MRSLPDNFESYNQARKNGFLKMKELKDAGQRIVGIFCSFVPVELVEAAGGTPVSISAMCTFFAESEVIGHIGAGSPREDIAAGVIDSVASRVSNLVSRFGVLGELYLTGGLCDSPYFISVLSRKTNRAVTTHPMARYAGALGAALAAAKQKTIDWSGL